MPVKDPPSKKKKPRTVEVVRSDYQPSKAELEEDLSIAADFLDLVERVVQPVTIRTIPRPKAKKE